MVKRIKLVLRNEKIVYGDWYAADSTSPILYDYAPHITEQDFDEMNEAMKKYRKQLDDIDRWSVENGKQKEE